MSSCSPVLVIAVVLSIIGTIVVIAMIESPLVYWKCRNSEGERKLLSAKSSQQNSTSNIAEGQNLISQVDPVQTATAEHQREVVELKSNLRDKDETIRRLTEELNDLTSKQSPVECYLGHPTIHRNPSTASRGVSKPTDHPQEQLPQHINPKPAADSNHPKSVKLSQNKDAKPSVSRQIPEPGLQIPGSSHNIHVSPADHPEGKHGGRLRSVSDSLPRSNTAKPQRRATISPRNRFSVLANLPNDGSEPLLE
ncbi:uncharacterized protein [Clinocottus analis]|uniref:uncharacterized protein n=1 Tax=Clinocottus analis TaxID=304258 RepID=UPI0035C0FE2B